MLEQTQNFAIEYSNWLTKRLSQSVRDGVVELSTPFLDSLNDGMRVYFEQNKGNIVIHDNGITLETLELQGVDVHVNERRKSLCAKILNTAGVTLEGDRLQTIANNGNLPQRIHFLLTAMHQICDLWLTVRHKEMTDFFEKVCNFLDEKEVLYTTSISIPGKTVEHPIDIVIPLPERGERLIKLIGTPNVNTAKIVSFSWIEIEELRPSSDLFVLLNDELGEDSKEIRGLSEQTASILRGYSTEIYSWSSRNNPDFEGFWKAA